MDRFEKIIVIWVLSLGTLVIGSLMYVWISDLRRIEDLVIETEADLDDIKDCLKLHRYISDEA